ncbi:MAG: FAD:protein FMN transferase [Tepidisphaeraceae bacterium]
MLGRCTLLLIAMTCVTGCTHQSNPQPPLERFEYAQLHMGVQARLVVYAPSEQIAADGCRAAYARVAALEDIASDYRPDSELMRLCAKAGQGSFPVSAELFELLSFSQELSRRSDGAFDVTVGPYVALWRAARKSKQLPTPEALADARGRVGWERMKLDAKDRTVTLDTPGMRLDLGGIAKGYAGDEAIRVLRAHGVRSALFEAGGDIVVSDPPPGKKGWAIEIAGDEPGAKRTIELANRSISTSGDTEQFVEIDGKRYSHIVDPRTGLGLTDRYAATIVARDGITADSLSTAACVLGKEKGEKLVKSYRGATAYIRRVG